MKNENTVSQSSEYFQGKKGQSYGRGRQSKLDYAWQVPGFCTMQLYLTVMSILIVFLMFFLPLAHNHPTGVLISQGSSRTAHHRCADVSG